jgi:hypothetical protein
MQVPELTTDPNDPRLGHGSDSEPVPQNEAYLILSQEERDKGFVRPYRTAYRHVGPPPPAFPLRDLTEAEKALWGDDYVKFEVYPESESPKTGKFWTQAQLDNVGNGCGTETIMGQALSETYARDPHFYGSTYCARCRMHRLVFEFVWSADGERVGS